MTATSEAWLLDCGNMLSIAVGDNQMAEFVQQQEFYSVPGSPGYCSGVIVWQGNIVPVMDLASLYDPAASNGAVHPYLCVLRYQSAPNSAIEHLALRVTRTPQKIVVDDQHSCEIPEYLASSVLGEISLACFNRDELPVMIPDIARLCSAEFRELANAA